MSHISVEQVCTMWATEDEFEEEERKNWGVCWLRLVWLTTQQVRILEMFFAVCIFCVCVYTYVYVYILACMCRGYLYSIYTGYTFKQHESTCGINTCIHILICIHTHAYKGALSTYIMPCEYVYYIYAHVIDICIQVMS